MTDPKKQLWILAGGNGAGKTTFYNINLEQLGIVFVNADLIAKEINPENPNDKEVNSRATALAGEMRDDYLLQGIPFCYETVFSHSSKIDFVAEANRLGYEIILIYIHLVTSDLNEARVHQRVAGGGHSVPVDKIHSRIPRTKKYISEVLKLVDEARLLDNSSRDNPFQQVAILNQQELTKVIDPLPKWAKEMLRDFL